MATKRSLCRSFWIAWAIALIFSQARGADELAPISSARELPNGRIAALTVDHSAIYFCSVESVSNWNLVRLPTGVHFIDIVGGCDKGTLVRTVQDSEDQGDPELPIGHVELIAFDGTRKELAARVGTHCEFYDDLTGCQAQEGNILVTLDGGHSWKAIPTIKGERDIPIIQALWLSPHQLLVTRSDGMVASFRPEKSETKTGWRVSLKGVPRSLTAVGSESIWLAAGDEQVILLDALDGRQRNATNTKSDADLTGLAADSIHLYAFGSSHPPAVKKGAGLPIAGVASSAFIDLWMLADGRLAHKRTWHPREGIDAIMPLGDSNALILQNQKIRLLGGADIIDQPVTITDRSHGAGIAQADKEAIAPMPGVAAIPPANWLPTQDDQTQQAEWSKKVPFSDFVKILQEAGAHSELTPRQRTLYLTAKCKELWMTQHPTTNSSTQPE